MSDGVVIAIITSSASLLLAVVNGVIAALQRRAQKKSDSEGRLERIENSLAKLTKHNELQYMSLLRLTVMDSDMPMSERLIAGQEYLDRGGNGDVRHFYEHLRAQVDGKEVDGA